MRELSRRVQGLPPDPEEVRHVEVMTQQGYFDEGTRMGTKEGVDADDLAQVGWGVVFAEDADPRLRDSLEELLEHRRRQAGPLFQAYDYRRGEDKWDFLARHGASPGPVDPEKVPYYLLLVGGPETLPFSFQYQIDVEYAVGRLHFEKAEDYAAYAHGVVKAEETRGAPRRRATFFAPKNPGDRTTERLSEKVAAPLADWIRAEWPDWEVRSVLGEEATKAALAGELGEGSTLSLLFTAAHGIRLPNGHPAQRSQQGALVCQEWSRGKPADPSCYFWADDVEETAPHGVVAFLLTCYGCGTPRFDSIGRPGERTQLAPEAFVSALPQRLLARGALAVIGKSDRVMGYSYIWGGEQLETFRSPLRRLLDGHTVGSATEYLNHRGSELAAGLVKLLGDVEWGRQVDDEQLARMWSAHNDARSYVVFGDPAVRLAD